MPPEDSFEWHALQELHEVKETIERQRATLTLIILKTLADGTPPDMNAAMARVWLLGTVESALWRIEGKLKGDINA